MVAAAPGQNPVPPGSNTDLGRQGYGMSAYRKVARHCQQWLIAQTEIHMKRLFKPALVLCTLIAAGHAMAQVTFYENEGYRGRAFTTQQRVGDFTRYGFNDKASSVVVTRGMWEACEDVRFEGRCVILRPGSYDSLRRMGFDNRVSSVRPVRNDRQRDEARMPEPLPTPDYEYRRRPDERVFQAPVTSVHAVVGPPNQRCWMERQQVSAPVGQQPNVGGAVIGGLIGGILGHQVGGGTGKQLATVGGAVAGAAIGSNTNIGGGNQVPASQDVQRCENVANTTPAYWDVSYTYRGQVHQLQMTSAPGPTISVNANGEPRQ
jgi:uncharacterized protein YcfJ